MFNFFREKAPTISAAVLGLMLGFSVEASAQDGGKSKAQEIYNFCGPEKTKEIFEIYKDLKEGKYVLPNKDIIEFHIVKNDDGIFKYEFEKHFANGGTLITYDKGEVGHETSDSIEVARIEVENEIPRDDTITYLNASKGHIKWRDPAGIADGLIVITKDGNKVEYKREDHKKVKVGDEQVPAENVIQYRHYELVNNYRTASQANNDLRSDATR